MTKKIYLDYHATTPIASSVLDAMMPYLTTVFGNPASQSHPFGWEADAAVEHARSQVATLIGADPKEIIWTSGATESINLAMRGLVETYSDKGRHIVTCRTEHSATLDTCRALEAAGYEVTYLPVDSYGVLNLSELEASLRDDTVLLSIMHANNEIGTIHPIKKIGAIAKAKGVIFHVDAAQSFGKLPIDVQSMGIDLLSFSAHKIYGPKGIGGLYMRRKNPRVKVAPILHGGGHERGIRPGTLNVPGIVGLGAAASFARQHMEANAQHTLSLRDRFYQRLREAIPDLHLNGHPSDRLSHNLNICLPGIESSFMMSSMRDVACSSGSACNSAAVEPSHVLTAIGLSPLLIRTSLRFGFGIMTTLEEVDLAADRLITCYQHAQAAALERA